LKRQNEDINIYESAGRKQGGAGKHDHKERIKNIKMKTLSWA